MVKQMGQKMGKIGFQMLHKWAKIAQLKLLVCFMQRKISKAQAEETMVCCLQKNSHHLFYSEIQKIVKQATKMSAKEATFSS